MKWSPHLSRQAIQTLYTLPRPLLTSVKAALRTLEEEPVQPTTQALLNEPSIYSFAVDGDVTIYYEIVDEQHILRIIRIA